MHIPQIEQPFSDRVLSIREAAAVLGMHETTLRRLGHQNRIKFLKLSARRIGIRASELRRFLAAAGGAA